MQVSTGLLKHHGGCVANNEISIHDMPGAALINYKRHIDDRGYFQEVFSTVRYDANLPHVDQVNLSCSRHMAVRGLHIAPFAKLCTVLRGKVYDVIADTRKDSPTYGKWCCTWLSDSICRQVLVPPFCAHGFFCAEDGTYFLYQQNGLYDPTREKSLNWRDPTFNIKWPEMEHVSEGHFILSDKDRTAPFLDGLDL